MKSTMEPPHHIFGIVSIVIFRNQTSMLLQSLRPLASPLAGLCNILLRPLLTPHPAIR